MTNSPVQEIKDRLDIVEFIRSYVQLLPAGKNFRACCPFHKEKTPSFMVSPDRQTWHCFGACAEGGDIFKFVMKHDNLEFYEALKFLAEKAGVELRKFSPADQRQFGVLYDINDSAKKFFQNQLKLSKEASDYLISRGLKNETIEEFERIS
ncbi:MAG: CHC2 zinc finger domain-containing protein [Patescibacteria group bacterium]|nr:CHC2 zinc finger domain-containing protein [Patescibacteria group bacterium]